MSNFQKSFNFRNGVQVDTDDLIVRGSLVGIGTTVPTEQLDVRGTTKVVGLVTAQDLHIVGVATIASQLNIGLNGEVTISNGIITSTSGIITYYGDARYLQGMPTSQWVDTDVGLGFTSIYASGNVGVGTTDPRFSLQIGGNNSTTSFVNGVGFSRDGNAWITGILTAGFLSGSGANITSLNASNISSGTIDNAYLPTINNSKLPSNIQVSGIVTAQTRFVGNLVGNVTGIATLARGITDTPNIDVGILTATNLDLNGSASISSNLNVDSNLNVSGLSTISQTLNVGGKTYIQDDLDVNGGLYSEDFLYVGSTGQLLTVLPGGNVGLGTSIPSSKFQVRGTNETSAQIISSNSIASVSVGQSVGAGNSSAVIAYDAKTLKITNYDTGGINLTLHAGTGSGSTEGFKVRYDNANIFNVTYDGRVSIGRETPDPGYGLHLQGSSYITGNQVVVGIITIGEGGNKVTFGDGSPFPIPQTQNFDTVTGISTFHKMNLLNTLSVGQTATFESKLEVLDSVGIGTSGFLDVNSLYEYKLSTDGGAFIREGLKLNSKLLITDQVLDENGDIEFLTDPRDIPNAEPYSSWVPYLNYGGLQVENNGVGFISQEVLIVPYRSEISPGYWGGGVDNVGIGTTLGLKFGGSFESNKYLSKVGINTFFPRAVLDVGTASTTMNSFILPPRVTNSELNIIRRRVDKYTPEGTPEGAFLYNLDTHRLEVGIGTTTFCGIVTLTNNHSGYYSLVPPIVDNTGRSGLAQTSFGAIIYNSSSGVHQGYGSGGWVDLTNSGTASVAGIATYAITAGIATYATTAGIATYATRAGVATYTPNAGIATYATTAGIATYTPTAGIATALTATSSVNTTGILTASILSTGAFGVGINIDGSTISGPSQVTIDPAAVGDNTGSVRIKGDLYVDGTQTYINSTTIELADFNVGIATTVGSNATLDGAGIGIGSTGIRKTITWNNTASALTSSEDWNLVTGKQYEIAGTSVLNATTLGSGVVNSSLTSVGSLGQLNVTGITTLASSGGITTTGGTLFSKQISVSGIVTANTFRPSSGYIQAADGTNSIYIYNSNGNVAFQGTIGATKINNGSGFLAIDFGTTSTPTVIIPNALSVTGVTTLGVTTATDLTLQQVNVSGLSTFVGVTTNNSTLFGRQLSISGVSTFVGVTTSSGSLFGNQLSISGVSTFVGVTTSNSTIFGNQLSISGVSTFVGVTTSNSTIFGNQLSISGVSTHIGVSTFQSTLFGTQLSVVGPSTLGGVTTSTGSLFGNQLSISGVSTYIGVSTFQSTLFGRQVSVSGVSTFGNTVVGGASTQLVVTGDTRITGILTVGTGSITLNGSTDVINVGVGVTIYGSSGVGVVSATTFRGTLAGFAATAGYAVTAKTAASADTATFASSSENANTANTATTLGAASNVNTIGIVTAQGGFTSGSGQTPVKITISGNTLTFTVTGVGSTSLTLY